MKMFPRYEVARMKIINIIGLSLLIFLSSCSNDKKTADLEFGTMQCLMCSINIEEAVAELKGIKKVEVDLKSQSGKVVYRASMLSISDIEKTITSIGYSVNGHEANKDAYNILEQCCKIQSSD
ncbi:MAG: hypothetical protein CMF81_05205 [Candidatus Marinimicrobia bacterium]|nr:hypothetical protein [Candidatus Neomarinimicrobiota bacterium]